MPPSPRWQHFLPRFPLGVCACARSQTDGSDVSRWYARSTCPDCNGAGVVLRGVKAVA